MSCEYDGFRSLIESPGILGTHFHPLGGPTEFSFSSKQASGERSYIGPASEATTFARKLIGGFQVVEGEITYQPEYQCHQMPWLYAEEVKVRFHGDWWRDPTSKEVEWEFATVTCSFRSKDYEKTGDDAGLRMSIRTTTETFAIEGGTGVFASGQVCDAPIPFEVVSFDLNYDMEKAPSLGEANITKAGKVNNATWRTYAAGKILFANYEADGEQRGLSEEPTFKRKYSMKYRDIEHNKHFNKYTGAFEEVTFPNGRKTYLTTDLTNIFD